MDREQEVLEKAEAFLKAEVAPKAQIMDWDPAALKEALDGLCRLDLMALKRPSEFGGPGFSDASVRLFQQLIARYSGALAFLQTQHQGTVGMIASSQNEALRNEYLPIMGNGGRLVGVGFSQLRRPGPPIMRADRKDGGYVLNGKVPWITGKDFYPEFMIGAALEDGRALFAPVPLQDQPGIKVSEPMRLAAMGAANTVSADFDNFFVPDERVVLIRDAGWIQNNDQINIAQQGAFALGCAQAGLDILAANAEKRHICSAQEAYDLLTEEHARLKRAMEDAKNVTEETTQERLQLRAWMIDLAVRCAHAAVASSSGAANSMDHPAQRVYREALVYTVSAQTGPIMDATLARITARA
jgi:alkylation response protein AidB-like acyl-CoA dehydrogenase